MFFSRFVADSEYGCSANADRITKENKCSKDKGTCADIRTPVGNLNSHVLGVSLFRPSLESMEGVSTVNRELLERLVANINFPSELDISDTELRFWYLPMA